MKLHELKKSVDFALHSSDYNDGVEVEVYIKSFKVGCAGNTPATKVKSVYSGYDWDKGRFIIVPEVTLREIELNEIESIKNKYEELSWSHSKIMNLKAENKALRAEVEKLKLIGVEK